MRQLPTRSEIVSSERESLILVDATDNPTGTISKAAAHDGEGVLHRAFSLFVFNSAGELLLQRRAAGKRLWPSYWSNSCCSHPRSQESMQIAVDRRLDQELGIQASLAYLYKFEYSANYLDLGTEHELCWVYTGMTDDTPTINTTEIAEWRWINPNDLTDALATESEAFTPWLKLEWQRLTQEFPSQLGAYRLE